MAVAVAAPGAAMPLASREAVGAAGVGEDADAPVAQAHTDGPGTGKPQDSALPSRGSQVHGALDQDGQPLCQPCAWFYKETGCLNAVPCKYCHLCPQGELKNRKKKKIARLRSEENEKQAAGKPHSTLAVEEPAYVHLPELAPSQPELRRSITAPPKIKAEIVEAAPPGLDATPGFPPPLGLAAPPVLDHNVSLQLEYGPLFNSWGPMQWPMDPGAAFGYDPCLFPMAFPPAPASPLAHLPLGVPPPSPPGVLPPPPPERPPSLLEGGAPPPPLPPPPEKSPQGALGEADGGGAVPAAPAWAADANAGDQLAAQLQGGFGLELEPVALPVPEPRWEAPLEALGLEGVTTGGSAPALERATSTTSDAPFCGALSRAVSAELDALGAEQPELERTTTQTSVRMEEGAGGAFSVSWTVDARKLKASDKVAVSPAFEMPTAPGKFRMMLLPKVVDDRKGGASFKRAKGKGLVKVKCEEALNEPAGTTMALRLSVRSGGGSVAEADCQDRHELPRGPVKHDFAERGIFGLPKEQEEWDFGKIVNGSQTFVVRLEILPPALFDEDVVAPPGLSREARCTAEMDLAPPPGLAGEDKLNSAGKRAVEELQLPA
mmetsp:Transcript_21082/g.58423  ORF Transcript_21082/g.58423 Transcript_21082/m.58423 type:complete len:605 (-) Transcript_21082:177-1991(-)